MAIYSLLLIVGIIAIYIDYKMTYKMINTVSVMVVPYLLIIPINNCIMTNLGFYAISDKTILMLLLGISCYSIGSILANFFTKVKYVKKDDNSLKYYNVSIIEKYCIIVEIIEIIRIILIIKNNGISYLSTEDYEGTLIKGPLGRLLLSIYPLIPILFLFWYKNKNKITYLIVTAISVVILFFSFVKYHTIGMVMLLFLFTCIEEPKFLKKGILFLIIFIAMLFIGNYFAVFTFRGTAGSVDRSYYFNHLWNYIAGSLIYDNKIFTIGVRNGIDIWYKLGSFIFPPINLFLNKIAGVELFPHTALPHIYIGTNGEKGNVVDAFGYLYPSHSQFEEYVIYCIILIFIGFLFSLIFGKSIQRNNNLHICLAIFMTFFIIFSFFGTFYVMTTPWIILFFGWFMPKIFDSRTYKKQTIQ